MVHDLFKLDGRVALITGGNRGLGFSMAQALSEAGARVAVTSRDFEKAHAAAAAITESTGNQALAVAVDVTNQAEVDSMVETVVSEFGRIDILVNNAGVNVRKPVEEFEDWWESSDRRRLLREWLKETDGVDPDDVIMSPEQAKRCGLTSTVTFPTGNIAPEGSVINSTAIDPSVLDPDGIYRHRGLAKVFTSERSAIKAIKNGGVDAGDIMVLMGRGPSGTGMEETYQLTSALKYLPFGKHVTLITDARFSGVSTGACIGHVGPEALAGGPIGKLRNGDLIEVVIDRGLLVGTMNFVGENGREFSSVEGESILAARSPHPDLAPDPALPRMTPVCG